MTSAQIDEVATPRFVVKQEPEQRSRDSYNTASDTSPPWLIHLLLNHLFMF